MSTNHNLYCRNHNSLLFFKKKESGVEPSRFCLPASQRFTAGPKRLTGSESCDPAQITSPSPLHWPALSWSVGGLVPRASSGQEDYRHPAEGKIFISSLIIAWSSGGDTLCSVTVLSTSVTIAYQQFSAVVVQSCPDTGGVDRRSVRVVFWQVPGCHSSCC